VRALATFFAAAALVVGAVAAFNSWLDPLGQFWDASALHRAERSACFVSDDLVGTGSWLPFKEDVFRDRDPAAIVVGTSRVLKISGGDGFANLGMPGTGIETLAPLFRRLRQEHAGPLTVYLGVELFWLNRTWQPNVTFRYSLQSNVKYALARQTLSSSVRLVRAAPSTVFHRWSVERTGGLCIVDRGKRVLHGEKDAWAVDGSFVYRHELGGPRLQEDEYTRDLVDFDGPYYRDWYQLDRTRIAELAGAVRLARSYGWRVVGYTPPYSGRYSARIEQVFPRQWSRFPKVMRDVFGANGYRWVDLRRAEDVPCDDDAFEDDGWHPDGACSAGVLQWLRAVADE
jgi:hypothetical protein